MNGPEEFIPKGRLTALYQTVQQNRPTAEVVHDIERTEEPERKAWLQRILIVGQEIGRAMQLITFEEQLVAARFCVRIIDEPPTFLPIHPTKKEMDEELTRMSVPSLVRARGITTTPMSKWFFALRDAGEDLGSQFIRSSFQPDEVSRVMADHKSRIEAVRLNDVSPHFQFNMVIEEKQAGAQ